MRCDTREQIGRAMHVLGEVKKQKPGLLVIGDVMLDRRLSGECTRKSPEHGGINVFKVSGDEISLGGAGAVASMVAAMNCPTMLFGCLGEDMEGMEARRLLYARGIASMCQMVGRTTTKTRLIDGRGRPFAVRVDYDATCQPGFAKQIVQMIAGDKIKVVLIADYGKGVCTPDVLEASISTAVMLGKPVLVDPAHGADWERYCGATVIKPNYPEWLDHLSRDGSLQVSKNVVVTMGTDGMSIRSGAGGDETAVGGRGIPLAEVVDPCGAGDQALVGLGAAIAVGAPIYDACCFANELARLCVLKHGAVPTTLDEVADELADQFMAA